MSTSPPFDLATAHRWFSADCFNRVWTYLDKTGRSCDDCVSMLSLAHASLAHWRDREEVTAQNLSVGYWLISRVYSELEITNLAKSYGELSLKEAADEPPFYRAYGHEAIARAEKIAGNTEGFQTHLEKARALLEEINDADERALLESDLAGLLTAAQSFARLPP